jgi:hypothetical protein
MDGGVERIEDEAELAQVRRQARRVYVEALLVAIPATLVALALPVRARRRPIG